jgi:O-methyltransferase
VEVMFLLGAHFNVKDMALFKNSIEGLRKSLHTPDAFFCADNVITWNKNLSFLDEKFFQGLLGDEAVDVIRKSIIWRTYILRYFANLVKNFSGDFLEVGCYQGWTAEAIIEKVDFKSINKKYFLYDLFEHQDTDVHHSLPKHSTHLYDEVCTRFSRHSFVKIIKGNIPESFSLEFPDSIAFAHIDLNQAPAEVGALERILPRMAKGGVIILDDYGWWGYRKQKEAEDPLLKKFNLEVLELPTGQGIVMCI